MRLEDQIFEELVNISWDDYPREGELREFAEAAAKVARGQVAQVSEGIEEKTMTEIPYEFVQELYPPEVWEACAETMKLRNISQAEKFLEAERELEKAQQKYRDTYARVISQRDEDCIWYARNVAGTRNPAKGEVK